MSADRDLRYEQVGYKYTDEDLDLSSKDTLDAQDFMFIDTDMHSSFPEVPKDTRFFRMTLDEIEFIKNKRRNELL